MAKNSKCIINAKPKVVGKIFLFLESWDFVKELIQFTGTEPKVTEDGNLRIRKWELKPPCFVAKSPEGNIVEVLTPEEFGEEYEVMSVREMEKSDMDLVAKKKKEQAEKDSKKKK